MRVRAQKVVANILSILSRQEHVMSSLYQIGYALTKNQDLEVRRRYSEFASLREALAKLHPTLIIPPIPEKHTMADYAANPTKAKQDQQIIDLRKRMLAVFLNRCRRMKDVRTDGVWWRFLDPNSSWVCPSPSCATLLTTSRARFSILIRLPLYRSQA